MKIKHLIMTLAGVLIALASCKKEDGDKVPAGLTVDKVSITAGTEGATEVIKVTSSAAWTVTVPAAAQGWLHVSPAKGGKGTTKVTVTVDPNQDPTTGRSRKARINFIAGIYAAGTSVSQEGVVPAGDGLTVETAFSASEAHAWVMANLESNKESSGRFFVKGKISKITAPFATATDKDGKPIYKATFYITDDGNEDKENDFEAYQVFYLGQRLWREGDDDIAVGDEVILNCKFKRYESTAENNGQYPYLYSLNGEKSGKASAPSIDGYEAKTIAEFIAAAKTDTYYKLSGIVSQFKLEGNPTQGYLDDGTGTVQIYGVDDMSLWSEVENDGTLTIAAKYKKYEKNGNVTHEAVDCLFGSFVKGESVVAEGDGSLENPFNAAAAIQCVKDNGDKTTDDAYYVKGKIANIRNPYDEEHGTAVFSISADGTMKTTFLCYSILFLENKAWKLGNTQIKLGDEVIVHSRLTVYDGTYETLSQKEPEYKGYLYSLNGKTAAEVAPVIVIEDFSQTADGFKANWTYNLLTATTEFDWTVSGPTGTNVSGKVTGTELDYKMSMTAGEEYTLTVTCGEATASKTLTAQDVSGGNTWTAVTKLDELVEGTYTIACLHESKYYAIPETTISAQTFNTCVEGTLIGSGLVPGAGSGEFVLTAVEGKTNAYYIYNTKLEKYLAATGSKTFGYVDNKSTDYGYWTFEVVESGGFSGEYSVQHSGKTHYLRAYNNTVRCYDGKNNKGVYFFKK